jgi:thioredoxin 1
MENTSFEQGPEPTRADIDQMTGPVVLEFGADWCGYCNALRPHLAKLLREFPQVKHIRIEDGKGLSLGRSFRVKLWPTFVFMRDGQVVHILVRPAPEDARTAFETL